ncbi:Catalase-peroxidase [Seminavis robusta]|uniref:Catalase-peroxidase n=1 Tax=Seminavis robusta TaxID=568900 RepID=A0A9N8E3X1_9STRA|nr:Catalase-peroxidase [Seminavis robusta]|eukprot:Sro592_g172160.1 Catalase-peroxidase (1312) ;mRNA; r:36979-41435
MKWSKSLTALLLLGATVDATCPFAGQGGVRGSMTGPNPHTEEGRRVLAKKKQRQQRRLVHSPRTGDYGIPEGGFAAVREDIKTMLVTSQDFFPADFEPPIGPNYGGLMIRLAWHCSGSYRASDGRGGCDGGRIRFDPELNWEDNANLNNAMKLLEPIKEKYGSSLSWGDLITLTGTTAIEFMGGPVLGFCGGRIDDVDGSDSLILGPSDIQEELSPCKSIGQQGACESPLGPTTVGLIYVNPAGPVNATGNPVASGLDIRQAFARMGFNDTETVAIIGGGHAFGKCHGACTNPPCGEEPLVGIGPNTFTSGFEGAWTTAPTTWTNLYFTNLLALEWESGIGPGGNLQWAPVNSDDDIIMLTSDIALSADPEYLPISQEFAADITSLEEQFAHAWYRLMSNDMGSRERCINENPDDIPPAQWWQYPLPEATETDVDYVPIRTMIQDMIDSDSSYVEAFSNLAYRCASTYRDTDYRGGCNGARIRFEPENDWPENEGTEEALAALDPVKVEFPEISYADLIVLAGHTAIEAAGGKMMPFCGGRVDAIDGSGSVDLAPRYYTPAVVSIRDDMQVKGLSPQEGVALFAKPAVDAPLNQFFVGLVDADPETLSETERALLEPEFLPIVTQFAESEDALKESFSNAWIHMMTSDRFDGPTGNVCDARTDVTLEGVDVLEVTRDYGIPEGGFAAVREDIKTMLVTSQDFFPADFEPPIGPNYGGLMIRLAWHCSGSYRASDGRGGCDGGRIRFDPELNWEDNANLNNAMKLLEPIKEKYGSSLSWGDLITLTGTTAIEFMGGPVLGFCGGRVDDVDGSDSLFLGPSDIQEELSPCTSIGQQGACESPLGPTTVGLIYVNPAGPVNATGNPVASGLDIRQAFARMGFNDTETVAIIGGGHAFGKCHGACTNPPCGEEPLVGIGPNTFTSGFEGAWTTAPTTWTNLYFTNLLALEWESGIGPGGNLQWAPVDSEDDIIMLTSDIALSADPEYLPISQEFAADISSLEEQFAHAWYRLMSNDMGSRERCINENPDDIPPAQWWQYPLPAMEEPEEPVDYVSARTMIQGLIDVDSNNIAAFANLAFRCASTYRATDYRAIESAGGNDMQFCGGRVDAVDGAGSIGLEPRYYSPPVVSIRDDMQVKGLTKHEGVALFAIPTGGDDDVEVAIERNLPPNALSNQYFVNLLAGDGDFDEYEMALLEDEFLPIVQRFAGDNELFLGVFAAAWNKMMTADRFDGPVANICDSRTDETLEIVPRENVPLPIEDSEDEGDDFGLDSKSGGSEYEKGDAGMGSILEGSSGVSFFSGTMFGLVLVVASAMI